MRKVLFVCTGNLCRSPMAEYALSAELSRRGVDDVLVESAGTMGIFGSPASRAAVDELKRYGIDMSPHRSRGLEKEMVEQADLVVVMERHHAQSALALDPGCAAKIVLMGSLVDGRDDPEIPDPLGRDKEFFHFTFGVIMNAVGKIADRLEGAGV